MAFGAHHGSCLILWATVAHDWHSGLSWLIIGNTLKQNIGKVEKQVEEFALCSSRVASLRILGKGSDMLQAVPEGESTIRHLRLLSHRAQGLGLSLQRNFQ